MSKTPFLPLFFGDFLASTYTWTGEEQSLYVLLLGYQWVSGPLPADERKLARSVRFDERHFRKLWPTVRSKFVQVDGGLVNERLEQHREKANSLADKNRVAGRKGAESRWQKDGERHESANGETIANAIAAPCGRHDSANGAAHSNPSHPIPKEEEDPQTPAAVAAKPRPKRKPSAKTPYPDDFTLDDDLRRYAADRLPNVDIDGLLESFRGKALAKGWEYLSWRQAFQEFVRNCAPNSGHWASGQYPKAGMGGIQWQ